MTPLSSQEKTIYGQGGPKKMKKNQKKAIIASAIMGMMFGLFMFLRTGFGYPAHTRIAMNDSCVNVPVCEYVASETEANSNTALYTEQTANVGSVKETAHVSNGLNAMDGGLNPADDEADRADAKSSDGAPQYNAGSHGAVVDANGNTVSAEKQTVVAIPATAAPQQPVATPEITVSTPDSAAVDAAVEAEKQAAAEQAAEALAAAQAQQNAEAAAQAAADAAAAAQANANVGASEQQVAANTNTSACEALGMVTMPDGTCGN
jgi:hypothetical protein